MQDAAVVVQFQQQKRTNRHVVQLMSSELVLVTECVVHLIHHIVSYALMLLKLANLSLARRSIVVY